MRKFTLAVLATAALLAGATPAGAVWKGQVCKTFNGPDGSGGVELYICLQTDDHDFEDQIRPMISVYNPGTQRAVLHVSYVRLIHDNTGNVVKNTGSFVEDSFPDVTEHYTTTWLNNPQGTYHSRARLWVCWPYQPGDPCGSVTIWNSGNVTYI